METPERVEFPDKIINWYDIAKGVVWTIYDFATNRHAHEGLPEHFITDAVDEE